MKSFNLRFYSDSPNEYPLLILGVAGNGKTIDINRRIRSIASGETEFEIGKAYFDLEDAFTKITYGNTFQCPRNSPLWLFTIKLMDGIMRYVRHCELKYHTIWNNFNNIIIKNNLADKNQVKLFSYIKQYIHGSNDAETNMFVLLKSMMSASNVKNNIQILLETLMLIMYCSDPDRKHYIVFDNIEQYIKLNNSKVQISNSDLSILYKSINTVVMNMTTAFSRIEKDLVWKSFKIIIVLRRTTIGLLDSAMLHSPLRAKDNIADITGHIQIPDIWEKKKKHIWNEKIKDKFNYDNNIIDILDDVMNDGSQAVGADYQSLIAPLMSYGIRRNVRSQAHAVYGTYKILTNGKNENINIDEFNSIKSAIAHDNTAIRYMYRRALVEFQFKWSISSGNKSRWKNLGIGYLSKEQQRVLDGKTIMVQDVEYAKNTHVSFMRRILTCLSYFKDNEHDYETEKSVLDMFSTISLYDLIKGVFMNPKENEKISISDDEFLQFARVLLSLSDMSNDDTRSAPYVILGVNDANFHINASEQVLSNILKDICDKGLQESLPGGKYNCSDFGARITDAGHSFLLDWQASFSFMASMHCFTIPPLFFLKNCAIIRYVIKTVYEASNKLCETYEDEAGQFCGNQLTLKRGTYLIKYNNRYVTFRQRVQELHINHLNLYRDYLEKNYKYLKISEDDVEKLVVRDCGYISQYIEKYRRWVTMEGAPECF